jgi:hypothetical protein
MLCLYHSELASCCCYARGLDVRPRAGFATGPKLAAPGPGVVQFKCRQEVCLSAATAETMFSNSDRWRCVTQAWIVLADRSPQWIWLLLQPVPNA